MIPIRVLGLPKSIEIDQRPDKNRQEIQARLFWGALLQQRGEQEQVTSIPTGSPKGGW